MDQSNDSNVKARIASELVRAGDRSYFVDVKEANNGTSYVVINEIRKVSDVESKRNSVVVFSEYLLPFIAALKNMAKVALDNSLW